MNWFSKIWTCQLPFWELYKTGERNLLTERENGHSEVVVPQSKPCVLSGLHDNRDLNRVTLNTFQLPDLWLSFRKDWGAASRLGRFRTEWVAKTIGSLSQNLRLLTRTVWRKASWISMSSSRLVQLPDCIWSVTVSKAGCTISWYKKLSHDWVRCKSSCLRDWLWERGRF